MVGRKPSREEVEAAALAEAERVGPSEVSKARIVARFLNRGVARSTLYLWVDGALKSGKVSARIGAKVAAAAEERARTEPDPVVAAARDVVEALPAPVSVARHIEPGAPETGIPFMQRLQDCLKVADDLLAHCRTPEGKVRNTRGLLAASEHVRRTIETAARIQDSLIQTEQIERFHQAIFDMLKAESPEFAERVLMRLRQLNAAWGLVP